MIQLTQYGVNVVNNFNLIGMWIAVLICFRNFSVCLKQYRKTRGKIHIVNLAQVSTLGLHRVLYGVIPLFEIQTCAYFPLLVSLWHITYILFYIVMFMRLIILEHDRYSRWIKVVGVLLITLRFADWPYELAFHSIQQKLMEQAPQSGAQCWVEWGSGVIILNFVGDALANLFLSGMFVRRLFIHINLSKSLMSYQNKVIEKIARKSLICLAFTFVVNLAMNLLKVTMFLGNHSDAFTVYFEIVESTLLVEALRNDGKDTNSQTNSSFCEGCHKEIGHSTSRSPNNDEHYSQTLIKTFRNSTERNKYNSTYTSDTGDELHRVDTVASMEPALFLEKIPVGSRAICYPSEHSGSVQKRNTDPVSPSDLEAVSSHESFAMRTTKQPSTLRTSSSTAIDSSNQGLDDKAVNWGRG